MKKWITTAILVVPILCLTGIAFAGVTQLSQTFVFPVTITQPGSYQLQSNLVVPAAITTAILVTVDNVTIDLNGFAILGPTVCTGSGKTLVCNPTGTGKGVDAGNQQNIKVYNGTVKGMGNIGILSGSGAIIESMRVIGNGGDGIFVNSGTVNNNMAIGNSDDGIEVGTSGTVSGNTATGNRAAGFVVNSGTVSGNTVTDNGILGIHVNSGTVSGNTVISNGIYGLSLGPSAGYVNNVLVSNGSGGSGNVSGGVNLKPNLCGTALCP
jgi:parallel beta-helix repeat protein